jgi:hypothetical protein
MALVKYNNNSISAITAAAGLTSGAMTLIKEQTASASATISFVDGTSDVVLDSTYPIYLFKFINIHPASTQPFRFQANAAGGSGYNETITSTAFRAYHNESDTATTLSYDTGNDQAQGTGFQKLHGNLTATGNDQGGCGELYIFSPSSTTFVKHFISTISGDLDGSFAQIQYVAGYFNTTSAIDEIQFKVDSGNIDSGTIKLYGIKDS